MKNILLIMFCVMVSCPLFSEDSVKPDAKMLYVEFAIFSPRIKKESFGASVRKMWRIHRNYLRLQEEPDPQNGLHILTISKAPDSYLINLFDSTAKHILDRSETTDIHAPLFSPSQNLPNELGDLEFGNEKEFILNQKGATKNDVKCENMQCSVYTAKYANFKVVLHFKKETDVPLKAEIYLDGKLLYGYRYLKYEANLKPDYSLFEVPKGIKITDAN